MGTFVVSMKAKRDPNGNGMYLSGTPTAVNAYGTFQAMRPLPVVPGSASTTATVSTSVIVADSPLNAGHIDSIIAPPLSASAIWITSKGAISSATATDNIVAIRNAFSAAAAAGHRNVFVPTGDFAYNGVISVSGSFTLMGQGPSSILRGTDWTDRTIRMMGSGPTVKDLCLLTNGVVSRQPNWEYTGIHVQDAHNFTITNIYLKANGSAGIIATHSSGPGTITQNTFSGTLADSIHLTWRTHSVTVKLNHIMKSGDDGVACASYVGDGGKVVGVEASYNWIEDNLGGRGMTVLGGDNINYHNNLIQGVPLYAGMYAAAEDAPWFFLACTNVQFSYNTVESAGSAATGHSGILIYSDSRTSSAITVTRCEIKNCFRGFRWWGPQQNILLDSNKMTNVGTQYVNEGPGVTTILYTSGNAGYPFTTPSSTESNQGDTIPPLSTVVDSFGAAWTVSGGVIFRNGVATISSNVTLLLYWNRRVYQQANSFGGWWVWDDNTSGWEVAAGDPRGTPSTPPAFPTLSRHPADFLQVGNPAIATYFVDDNRWGAAGISEGFGSPANTPADGFPRRIVATYWEAYNSFNQSYVRIQNVSQLYNVIFLFHCQFQNGEAGNGTPVFLWLSPSEVTAAQIQQCRNRGQKVILTVGGANHRYVFANRSQSDNFIAGIKTIISNMGGVDGIDFNNYEQTSFGATFITEMIYIAQQLKAFYGEPFAITSPAQPTNQQDRDLISAMAAASVLTWASPQYYDFSGFKNVDNIFNTNQQWCNMIGADQVVIGLGSGNYNTGAATTLAEANREVDRCLSANPTQRGVFSWNANFDNQQGFAFATNFRDKFSAFDATSFSAGAFSQVVERALTAGPLGQVAFRTQWSWPFSINGVLVDGNPNFSEVKAYPSLIYGARPGYRSTSQWPAFEKVVRLPDGVTVASPPAGTPINIANQWVAAGGSVSTQAPSGHTNSNLPRQLLITAGGLVITGRLSASATGKSHVSFDAWLQAPANPTQTSGFANSPITHEIMVPLRNFGGYGQHGNRNPSWYDHDVTIDGILYHVYAAKSSNGALTYSFGGLNGNYINEETGSGRTGWKFIIFQHDGTSHPLLADGSFRVNLGAMLNHCRTTLDSRGIAWVQGTEHCVAVEVGVEPVVGTGDCIIWDYRIV